MKGSLSEKKIKRTEIRKRGEKFDVKNGMQARSNKTEEKIN